MHQHTFSDDAVNALDMRLVRKPAAEGYKVNKPKFSFAFIALSLHVSVRAKRACTEGAVFSENLLDFSA